MTHTQPLEGKVAWVTGGAAGIGAETASRLQAMGATVGVLDIAQPTTDIDAIICDLADPVEIVRASSELSARIGMPDILIANAAIPSRGELIPSLSVEHWNRTLSVNLSSVMHLLQLTLPTMYERKWGRVVTVASGTAVRVYPGAAEYAASKAALIALTKVAAVEGASSGVTANVVAPGLTDTAMARARGASQEDIEQIVTSSPIANPMQVLLKPDDPAAAIAWFCHPDAGRITGQTLHVNGGSYMP